MMNDFRIIEVGQFVLMSRVYPESSTWYWTGRQSPAPSGPGFHRLDRVGFDRMREQFLGEGQKMAFVHVPIRTRMLPTRHAIRLLHNDFAGPAYRWLLHQDDVPLVGMDMNDGAPFSSVALSILEKCEVFFKREFANDPQRMLPSGASRRQASILQRNLHKIRPISLGLCSDRQAALPDVVPEKRYDVFFSGGMTSSVRVQGMPLIESLAKNGIHVDLPNERLSLPEFLHRCGQSFLVWSPEGRGWDCFRHYEAAAAGSVPVINQPWIKPYHSLTDRQNALFYDDTSTTDLVDTIVRALDDKGRLQSMGQRARQHVLGYHTHRAIVDDILQTSIGRLPPGSMLRHDPTLANDPSVVAA